MLLFTELYFVNFAAFVWLIDALSALTLLVGHQEEHAACKI